MIESYIERKIIQKKKRKLQAINNRPQHRPPLASSQLRVLSRILKRLHGLRRYAEGSRGPPEPPVQEWRGSAESRPRPELGGPGPDSLLDHVTSSPPEPATLPSAAQAPALRHPAARAGTHHSHGHWRAWSSLWRQWRRHYFLTCPAPSAVGGRTIKEDSETRQTYGILSPPILSRK